MSTYLHETVLRISGAIQVLEELLAEEGSAGRNGVSSMEGQPAVTAWAPDTEKLENTSK